MPRDDLHSLIEQVYAAALDFDLWEEWSRSMMAAFDARLGVFGIIDHRKVGISRSLPNFFLLETGDVNSVIREYFEGPAAADPQPRKVAAAIQSEVYRDIDHVDLEDPAIREFYNWQLARTGTRHHITATVVLNPTMTAGISLHRSPDVGVATDDDCSDLSILFPHFARALRLGFRHGELLQEEWWDGLQAQNGKAAILLDEAGGVLRVSPLAEHILREWDGITASGGRLLAYNPADNERINGIVQRAVSEREPRSGATVLRRRSSARPYQVIVHPLVRARRFLAPAQAAALVQIIDPSRPSHCLLQTIREMFALTEREAEVADLLVGGHSPESLAAALEISANTVRVHLRSLFRKTGTTRQSELMRCLLSV